MSNTGSATVPEAGVVTCAERAAKSVHTVSAVAERRDEQHFARLVPNDEVGSKQNNYNLSVSTYVEQEDTREVINITELNAEIKRIVAREQVLRDEIDKIIAEIEV